MGGYTVDDLTRPPLLYGVIGVGAFIVLLIVVLVVRRGGKSTVQRAAPIKGPRPCGGCKRMMLADWTKCLFCGWAPVPRLEFIHGPMAGQRLDLTDDVTTLGSVAGNTVVLADPAVSRKHAGIRRDETGHHELADLGSTNGVYVNGHKVPRQRLADGDVVRIGNTEAVFRAA